MIKNITKDSKLSPLISLPQQLSSSTSSCSTSLSSTTSLSPSQSKRELVDIEEDKTSVDHQSTSSKRICLEKNIDSNSDKIHDELEAASFRWWLIQQRQIGVSPYHILDKLELKYNGYENKSDDTNELEKKRIENSLWNDIIKMGLKLFNSSTGIRNKISNINTLDDFYQLLQKSTNILLLIGAGISVSCGIPDFRSENGIYNRLQKYNLSNPQCMFDINFFRHNPKPFFDFSNELLPISDGYSYVPSLSHYFIKLLENKNKLLRCYSQNIDMLEHAAGISSEKFIQCHGSFEAATCLDCRKKFSGSSIRSDIAAQKIPKCNECDGTIKPDIVFFGESLSEKFHDLIEMDKDKADLVIVIGSSLKVNPVRSIIGCLPSDIPMVLINREVSGEPHQFDIELLGYCDPIISYLCEKLKWDIPKPPQSLVNRSKLRKKLFAEKKIMQNVKFDNEKTDGNTSDDNEKSTAIHQIGKKKNETNFEFVSPSTYLFKGSIYSKKK